jgi:hypothetical protein
LTFATLILGLFVVAVLQAGGSLWDHFQSVADVSGGRLLLILLDVDGDGRSEIVGRAETIPSMTASCHYSL